MAIQRLSYPERHVLRLAAYDYSESGVYFVTTATEGRRMLFGDVQDGNMRLNGHGAIVERCWYDLVEHYEHIALDEFVVMPNHVHGVVWLRGAGRAGLKPAPTRDVSARQGLSEIVRAFKTFSARAHKRASRDAWNTSVAT